MVPACQNSLSMKGTAERKSEQRAPLPDCMPRARLLTVTSGLTVTTTFISQSGKPTQENVSELSSTERGWINWDSDLFFCDSQSHVFELCLLYGVLAKAGLDSSTREGSAPGKAGEFPKAHGASEVQETRVVCV